jgi:hypothetical protein
MNYVSEPRWLLLGHQLPTRSSNARVKTWRRLQQIGAVPARNSLYVLPNVEQCREDFEWMRTEIVALGGEATVFAAEAISEGGTEAIEALFRRSREHDYRTLKGQIDRLLPRTRRRSTAAATHVSRRRALRTLRERFEAIERVDFFRAAGAAETVVALAALERSVVGRKPAAPDDASRREHYVGRQWVTRPRPGVDRMASAWLIRRHIDPRPTFAFTEQPGGGDIAFDMYSGEFSHHGDNCTFETLAERFGLVQPAISRIADIVHDLDMKDAKYGHPETVAIGRIVDGLRASQADDSRLLEQGMEMFEALARSFESDQAIIGSLADRRKRTATRK